MILNIFALLSVLGITFMHSMFGLFSGIINVFCSITALAVAFGFAEPLNDWVTSTIQLHSAYTEPFALILLFVVTLVVLRLLTDTLLRGNVRVPMYLDWGGGAVCGFINAQIIVGVMATGFMMLPFGGRVMMYSAEERAEDDELDPLTQRVKFESNSLWLHSDAFAIGLFNLLSNGSLRGSEQLENVYPDYAQWAFWSGNTVQHSSLTAPLRDEKGGDGFKNGLRVDRWWKLDPSVRFASETTRYRRQNPTRDNAEPSYAPFDFQAQPGHRLIGARLLLTKASADRGDKTTPFHRFRSTMIRIVGDRVAPDGSHEPHHYVPQVIGGADSRIGTHLRVTDIDSNFSIPGSADTPVDVYFEVPDDFEPRFVEYRRHARAALTAATLTETPPTDRLTAAGGATDQRGRQRSGPASFIDTVIRGATGDNDRLPFLFSKDRLVSNSNVDLRGNLFMSGRLSGDREALMAAGGDASIERFLIPEGKRIFQLQTRPKQAASLPGQVLNFVGSVTNAYYLVDDTGDTYILAGYYALIQRDGREYIELFFTPDPEAEGFNGMLRFSDDTRRDLRNQDDAILGLLFVVPPGKSFDKIKAGGSMVEFGEKFRVKLN